MTTRRINTNARQVYDNGNRAVDIPYGVDKRRAVHLHLRVPPSAAREMLAVTGSGNLIERGLLRCSFHSMAINNEVGLCGDVLGSLTLLYGNPHSSW